MAKQEMIEQLRKEAGTLTGIPEISDKEYQRIEYKKQNKRQHKIYSKVFKLRNKVL